MYKACIFDLDGTLADSVYSLAYCGNKALESVGLKGHNAEKYKKFAGDGADELIRRCLRESGDSELFYYEKVRKEYSEIFKENCMYKVKPYDGIEELTRELKKRNIKMAVLSNKPHERTEDVIKAMFGDKLFDIVLGKKDDTERKPSPMGALIIAKAFELSPTEIIYMGDTNTDMMTGKNAGMFTVGVTWGFREREELEKNGADKIIDKPNEILDLL